MKFSPASIKGVHVVDLEPLVDGRGWFARTFCKKEFSAIGFDGEWVQMNQSFTVRKGTIRGMHFQLPPFSEVKVVRCIAGSVYDVIIDLRKGSDTFLSWAGVELSSANRKAIYIPKGFAHGFQSLTDNTELLYLHSSYYAPGYEGGIRYDDPIIGIKWPLEVSEISPRDLSHPLLNESFKGFSL